MPFQSSVFLQQGFGVPGEQFNDGPMRAESFSLVSASAAYNVFGRAFTITSQGVAQAGSGGTMGLAGILVNPKGSALIGDGTNVLNPALVLPNNAQGELATMGSFVVSLPAAAAIGDLVVFDNTTGALSTITPSTPIAAGTTPLYAYVDYRTVTASGLAVITLTPNVVYTPAA